MGNLTVEVEGEKKIISLTERTEYTEGNYSTGWRWKKNWVQGSRFRVQGKGLKNRHIGIRRVNGREGLSLTEPTEITEGNNPTSWRWW